MGSTWRVSVVDPVIAPRPPIRNCPNIWSSYTYLNETGAGLGPLPIAARGDPRRLAVGGGARAQPVAADGRAAYRAAGAGAGPAAVHPLAPGTEADRVRPGAGALAGG